MQQKSEAQVAALGPLTAVRATTVTELHANGPLLHVYNPYKLRKLLILEKQDFIAGS